MTVSIYRHASRADFTSTAIEIEPAGKDRWRVVGKDVDEHHRWDVYEDAVVLDGKDPTGGEGKLFPAGYFIDADLRYPVTKAWLENQAQGGLDIS